MTPEDFDYFKSRVTKFISGSNRGIKFGSSATPSYAKLSGIFPKRSIPQEVLETIQKKTTSDTGEGIETNQRGILALGRITLDLEQTKNNLEKILEIIADDYKETQETNKKEIDEYRKRVANRGRIFGKKELGDKKSDVLGAVKKYVGSFFSGAGGAIRALSLFNLMQGILTGDPSKIIGPLLGIGLTYLPAIGAGIAGAVTASLVGKLFGGGAAGARGAAGVGGAAGARGAAGVGGALGRLGRFGGRAALVGGGIALASSIFNRPQEEQPQQRLEELTEQQKALTSPQNLVPIPQDDLKRFEKLNKKFEAALDFLLGKQKEQERQPQRTGSSGGGGGGGTQASYGDTSGLSATMSSSEEDLLMKLMIAEAGGEGELGMAAVARSVLNRAGLVQSGKVRPGTFGASGESISDIISAPGQYTPFAQGKLNRDLSQDEMRRAKAALEIAKNQADMRGRLEAIGVSSSEINLLMASTGFRNASISRRDQSQEVNQTLFGRHTFNTAGNVGKITPSSVRLSSSTPVRPATPAPRPVATAAPSRPQTQVTIIPLPTQQQSSPASAVSGGNDTVPSIDTTYPENFLALYSKLIYQIV